MDPLQERLARIGLQVIGRRGFVLGGGHAIELHGMGDRPSEDIDLFSTERGSPATVADKLLDAYAREGFTVMISQRTADLVQMEVTDVKGQSCKVDLGVFWRARVPVVLEVGPVLHPDDAVAEVSSMNSGQPRGDLTAAVGGRGRPRQPCSRSITDLVATDEPICSADPNERESAQRVQIDAPMSCQGLFRVRLAGR
jgi:Nucleotidyl transferase AbiEii toxin, Type IV TA system